MKSNLSNIIRLMCKVIFALIICLIILIAAFNIAIPIQTYDEPNYNVYFTKGSSGIEVRESEAEFNQYVGSVDFFNLIEDKKILCEYVYKHSSDGGYESNDKYVVIYSDRTVQFVEGCMDDVTPPLDSFSNYSSMTGEYAYKWFSLNIMANIPNENTKKISLLQYILLLEQLKLAQIRYVDNDYTYTQSIIPVDEFYMNGKRFKYFESDIPGQVATKMCISYFNKIIYDKLIYPLEDRLIKDYSNKDYTDTVEFNQYVRGSLYRNRFSEDDCMEYNYRFLDSEYYTHYNDLYGEAYCLVDVFDLCDVNNFIVGMEHKPVSVSNRFKVFFNDFLSAYNKADKNGRIAKNTEDLRQILNFDSSYIIKQYKNHDYVLIKEPINNFKNLSDLKFLSNKEVENLKIPID